MFVCIVYLVLASLCFQRVMKRASSLESTKDRKGKHFLRLLELQKFAEQNRNRPTEKLNPC